MQPSHAANNFTDRLAPEVNDFRVGPFTLREDLSRLERVRQAAAPEAAVLYATRVLEVLVTDAVRRLGLWPERIVAVDLNTLYQFNLLPVATWAWGHSLRRVGNDARHVQRAIGHGDVDLAVLYLERALHWFFCAYRFRTSAQGLTSDGAPLWSLRPPLPELLATLEAPTTAQATELVLTRVRELGSTSEFWCSPTLPAVLAELLLDQGVNDEAEWVLREAQERAPNDLRLGQLWGLCLSRTKRSAEVLIALEPLRRAMHPRDAEDGETEGIVAGALKRLGRTEESQRIYAAGWLASGQTHLYLGINAASMALLLGRAEEAAAIAKGIRDRLDGRLRELARRGDRAGVGLGYWDQATLAEAHLLLGDLDKAGAAFRLGVSRYPDQTSNHEVTRGQFSKLLDRMGLQGQAHRALD